MKIILGYIVFFLYMALVIAVGEAVSKKFNIDKEVCRKCEHIATGLSWLITCYFTGATIHTFIINLVGLLILALLTFSGLMKSVEREGEEDTKSYGLLYFGISTLVVLSVALLHDPSFFMYTGISYYCMVLGDGIAPLAARVLGKYNTKVLGKKTFFGALTVFAFSSLTAWLFSIFVPWMNFSALFILSVGALAAIVELFSTNCTDNLTVEFAVFAYLLLNHYGHITLAVEIALLASFLMVIVNGKTGALTDKANLVSWLYFMMSAFIIGNEMSMSILGMYILSVIVSVITLVLSNKRNNEKERLSRNTKQILANSLVAIVFSFIYLFTKNRIFVLAAYAAIVEEFADSMASDIGRLSKKKPRDILSFKELTAGTSGGVTLLGSFSALVGATVAMLIPLSFGAMSFSNYIALTLIAAVGVFVDSLLGSRLQVLYKCTVCGNDTERKVHCQTPTEYKKGIRVIDNSAVNLFSSVVTAIFAVIYLLLI